MTDRPERDVMAAERARTVLRDVLADHFQQIKGLESPLVETVLAMFPGAHFETTDRDGKPLRRLVLTGKWEVDPRLPDVRNRHEFVPVHYKGQIEVGCGDLTMTSPYEGELCRRPKSDAVHRVSLGEQPHAHEHCHNSGRPHLGPCLDAPEPPRPAAYDAEVDESTMSALAALSEFRSRIAGPGMRDPALALVEALDRYAQEIADDAAPDD